MDNSTILNFENYITRFVYKSAPVDGLFSRINKLINKPPVGRSLGERLVRDILDNDLHLRHGVDYFTEHVFEDMCRKLRFDFFIKSHSLLIEFDGDQHYTGSRFHRTRAEWIDAIQRDEIKNTYCLDNVYSLLRIPQIYTRHPTKLKSLICQFIEKIEREGPTIELDLYFQIKSGKVVL